MNRFLVAAAAGAWLLAAPKLVPAQEVSPRWTVEGRGLVASPFSIFGDDELEAKWQLIDIADSHLSSRFDQAIFGDSIAGFAFGFRVTDADSPVGPVFLYQAEGTLQGEHAVLRVGRTRRPVLGLTLPTLRDEDLLTFLYPLNPYSAGGLEEDVLFSDVAALTLRHNFRWHAQAFLESLRNTTVTGDPAEAGDFEPNAAGVRLYYDQLPELGRISRIKHVGLAVYGQRTEDRARELGEPILLQAQTVASVNLYPDPVHPLDLRFVSLYQHGATDLQWSSITDAWRSRYVSAAAAIRYLYAPYQLERFQAGLSGGYRRYIERDAYEVRIIPTLAYRLGVNVDVALQYAFSHRDRELAAATEAPRTEHLFELAFSYGFEVMFNDTIDTPRDILDADYTYIPVN